MLLCPVPVVAAEAGAGTCPNEAVRTEFSAFLPDCRAYDLVSPANAEPYFENDGTPGNVTDTGQRILGQAVSVLSAASGGALSYFSPFGLPGSTSDGSYFLSRRGSAGWSTENLVPPQSVSNSGVGCFNAYFPLFTAELSRGVFADGFGQGLIAAPKGEIDCATDDPLLVAGEPQELQNLFQREIASTPSYRLVNVTPAGVPPSQAWAQAASADLSEVVFDEEAQLTPEAPLGDDLYMWSDGTVRLVTFLPGGTPVQGRLGNGGTPYGAVGVGAGTYTHAVSGDGSRVFFEAEEALYVREHPELPARENECSTPASACTVELDATQGGVDPSGGGTFEWASADGSTVLFTDERRLTGDSTAEPGAPDLYEYDFAAPEGARLIDLTAGAGEPASVLGVSGVSEDGSYVYFVAEAALTGGQLGTGGVPAIAGQPNLYVRHAGTTTFIATLDANDIQNWRRPSELTARISPSGEFFAFNSLARLTGFDNEDAVSGEPDQEIFLYDAGHDELSCVSCAPNGSRPTGPTRISGPVESTLNEATPGHLQRNLSADGRVFFQTVNSLLPTDTNGLSDVYEYESHTLHLISGGGLNAISYFTEASSSGDDVFFVTGYPLVANDTDGGISVFDARVGGGFKMPSSATSCAEAGCRPAASAPPNAAPTGSATFSGPGNLNPPPSPRPPKKKSAAQIKAEKLAKALKACRTKHDRRKRRACEAQARKKHGTTQQHKRKAKARSRKRSGGKA